MVIPVVANQVGDRRASDCGSKHVRVCRKVRSVEAAPRMSNYADLSRITQTHLTAFLHRRRNAFDDRHARLPRPEGDIRLEQEVSMLRECRRVVVVAL